MKVSGAMALSERNFLAAMAELTSDSRSDSNQDKLAPKIQT